MVAPFLAELNERLFVHFIAGQWRASQSSRLTALPSIAGGRPGHLACAGAVDVGRARAGLTGGEGAALFEAGTAAATRLASLRAREGFHDPVDPPRRLALPGQGPLALLSAADAPLSVIMGALIAAAPRGILWKPAPGAAASAHLLLTVLAPRAGRAIALLQGDHRTGALVGAAGGLVWASASPAPRSLPAPLLSLSARVPRRR